MRQIYGIVFEILNLITNREQNLYKQSYKYFDKLN